MAHQCSTCKSQNPSNAQFCQNCRTPLSQGGDATVLAGPPGSRGLDIQTIIAPNASSVAGANPPAANPFATAIAQQREHTVYVVDISGSMADCYDGQYNKLEAAKRAGCSMIAEKAMIDDNDQIAIVEFNDTAQIRCGFLPLDRHNKTQLFTTLQSLTVDGGTDINEGLKAADSVFDWSIQDVVRRIILLTDGHGGHPLTTAQNLKQRGVVIDVIGVGDQPSNVDEPLLRKVASVIQGENRYRFIKNDSATLVRCMTSLAGKTQTS